MNLMLIIVLHLCYLSQLLKLGDLEFRKPDHIPSGNLVSPKGPGELTEECFEAMDDVLWDMNGLGLR